MICSVHTHSVLCDGKNTLAEMAAAAAAAGVVSFGASGHSHTEIPHDQGGVLPEDLTAYRQELLRLREAYRGKMAVLLGIEQDSCSRQAPPDWADYWIGSVHNLYDPAEDAYYCVDWDEEKLIAGRDRMFGGDMYAMAEGYYRSVAAMAARHPTILGHIDLITKLNRDGRFFDETHPRYQAAARMALHAADPARTLLEINTGAIFRGYRDTPYPALFLLKEWRKMGGRVILTADAHAASGIVYDYDLAADLARAAGFRVHTVLTADGMAETPL